MTLTVSQNNISVVVPAYNAEDTIALCLEAIFSKLKSLREVIVVDDCSTDRSVERAHGFPCRVLRLNERGFPGRARNLGAKEAKGRYILFIDSDVVLKEDISQKIAKYIKPEKNIIALVGIFSEEHPNSDFVSQYKNLHARYKYCILPDFISSLHTSITAIDRESFWKLGGFDESSRVEDVEFGETIVRKGYRIYLDKDMEVVHLKKINLKKMLVTDFWKVQALASHFLRIRDKRRIFREGVINDISLFLLLSMISSCAIFPFWVAGLFFRPLFIAAGLSLLIFLGVNLKFWNYLVKVKGIKFVLWCCGITFIDMNCAALAFFITLLKFTFTFSHQRH